jgi:hypothetical protein
VSAIRGTLVAALLMMGAVAAGAQNVQLQQAPLRIPQALVSGTALQLYLNSLYESIDVGRDQVVVELVTADVSPNSTYTLQVELGRHADSTAVGICNGHDAVPALMEVFPPLARAGWFAVVSYRNNPTRALVNTFNENAELQGTRQYLGADRQAIGFYADGPHGTRFSQDNRNLAGAAQMLFFKGTGINSGNAWLAIESMPVAASDGDYADTVVFIEGSGAVCLVECSPPTLTPVRRSAWGELKARYR